MTHRNISGVTTVELCRSGANITQTLKWQRDRQNLSKSLISAHAVKNH